ncbi:MAG TPA: sulfite oxidase [Pseudonocardia sp.]|uniref:sulfite oxidase n=1 Tax=Pseudonocardia sp. TaxID=60912 RepID=UPI002B4AEA83|nr:sulfite oxidase [Pseudonocardia sp.]HLU58969.1 sulfite oxidase [Pseudonocardia sp.]
MTSTSEAAFAARSRPSRLLEPGAAVTREELQLAARNHGLPLEMLCEELTPPGLHYVLTHFDIPRIDPAAWRLEIGGALARPVTLDLADLTRLPRRSVRVTLECAGNGRARLDPRPESQPWLVEAVGTAEWTGTPLAPLLHSAGLSDAARDVVFTGADHGVERGVEQDYQRGLPLVDALAEDVLIAYEMNSAPLPPQHGYPARLVVPGWYGMAHVKWLTRIDVITEPFTGYQNRVNYRVRVRQGEEPGEPVTRIEPRALLQPPGFPDFMTRHRFVHPGRVPLRGRAWSGWGPITGVEVSADGGDTWQEAQLGPEASGRWAWRRFSAVWDARPGDHELCVRARDATGRLQPLRTRWNVSGFVNNEVQRVPVTVLDA